MESVLKTLKPFLRKAERAIGQRLSYVLWFCKAHYTWLCVLVLAVLGGVLIFTLSWFCRYDRFDWWRWKSRACFRFVRFALTLCAAKFLILYFVR